MADAAPLTKPAFCAARLLFAGERALADGFALIGFETWPDADEEQLEELLKQLLRERESALDSITGWPRATARC